jgi:curved DNA-binding protein CbpA
MNDPYKVLGVGRTATAGQIKLAFTEKAKQFHPDAVTPSAAPQATSAEAFQRIKDAYDILKVPHTRRAFDAGAGSANLLDSTWYQARAVEFDRRYKTGGCPYG